MFRHKRIWVGAVCACTVLWSALLASDRQSRDEPALHASPQLSAAERATQRQLGLAPLEAGGGIHGRVVVGNAAIQRARVCAACVHCEPTHAPPAPCVESDAAGRFAFDGLLPGGYFVHASAEGYVPDAVTRGEPAIVTAGEPAPFVEIALVPGGAKLSGFVADATGGPIANARLRAIRLQPSRVSIDVRTDGEGRFAIWLQPGFIELFAEADGYARTSLRATAPSDVELRLLPGASIEGVVVRAGTREPIANVEVKAAPPENPQLAMARGAVSDGTGRFRIDGLDPGLYLLTARAARLLGTYAGTVELGIAESAREVVIELQTSAEVSGRVQDERERPCRQGLVALGPRDLTEPPSREELAALQTAAQTAQVPEQVAEIQADGSVHFPGVPPGQYFVTVRCASQLLAAGPRVLRVERDPIEGITWTVRRGATLRVRVVDERARALPHVQFLLEHPSDTATIVSAFETDAEGACEIDGLRAGSYRLLGSDAQSAEPLAVELPDAASVVDATLRLAGSQLLVVEVVDQRGAPVDALSVRAARVGEGASVAHVGAVQALPLGQGRYRVGPISEGRYAITVNDGVNPPPEPGLQVEVAPGARQPIRLTLDRAGEIRGLVLDDRGQPAPDVWVSVKPSLTVGDRGALHTLALSQATQRRVLTDADGRFAIDRLASSARYDVRALEPYGSSVIRAGVAAGETVQLTLPLTAAISGVALDERGLPLAHFYARAQSTGAGSQQLRPFRTADGRFAIQSLAPGPVQLALFADDGRSAVAELVLAPGEHRRDLRLQLSAAED